MCEQRPLQTPATACCPPHADLQGGPGTPHPEVGHLAGGAGFRGSPGWSRATPSEPPATKGQHPHASFPGRVPNPDWAARLLCGKLGHRGTATAGHFPPRGRHYSPLPFSSGEQPGGQGAPTYPHPTPRSRATPGQSGSFCAPPRGERGPHQARPVVLFGSRHVPWLRALPLVQPPSQRWPPTRLCPGTCPLSARHGGQRGRIWGFGNAGRPCGAL